MRVAIRLSLFVYLGIVLWVTVRPLPGPAAPVALVPLVDTWRQMRDLGNDEAFREVAGNIALFVPLGFLLAATLRAARRFATAVTVGAGISLAIEILQLYVKGRSTSVDDFICNTIGAAVGAAVFVLVKGAVRFRQTRAGAA